MTNLEKLARQLEIIGMSGYGQMNVDFDVLAKHVQRLILEAKIESHSFYLSDDVYDVDGNFAKQSIEEFQQELRKCE